MSRMLVPFAISIVSVLTGMSSIHAQIATVPIANAKGDFTTARIWGNHGYYQNTHWLVVDSSGSVNCRSTPNGVIKKKLEAGWLVTAAFPSQNRDAIVMSGGSPWLRVFPQDPRDGGKKEASACLVRANNKYIAPISEDFMQTDASK